MSKFPADTVRSTPFSTEMRLGFTPLSASSIADSGMSRSWYLTTSTISNVSLNIHPVWQEYRGAGVKVAVLDSGIDFTHSELSSNYRTDLDYDLVFDTANYRPSAHAPLDRHGTQVAGVIAADNNNALSVGVAPDVSLIGFAIDYDSANATDQLLAGLRRGAEVDVLNGSWGFEGAFSDNHRTDFAMRSALQAPVQTGRGGLGTVVVMAGGNERGFDSSNYHSFQNSPLTIAVGAVDRFGGVSTFSSPGFNLLVSAPGTGVFTTTLNNGSGNANGTSFAAPVVSGIVALMLDANENLGYRDVQAILTHSGRQITSTKLANPGDYTGWLTTKSTNHNGGGAHYSGDYGFGYVNAHDAVRLAESWQGQNTLANRQSLTVESGFTGQEMVAGQTDQISVTLNVTTALQIEHVQVTLAFDYQNASDVEIFLISPLGFTSQLAYDLETDTANLSFDNFALTSVAHYGESSQGQWTVQIVNHDPTATGLLGLPLRAMLTNVTLEFFGSGIPTDDVYIYTDELGTLYSGEDLAARLQLADSDGGTDMLNAAALTSNAVISLVTGSTSTLAGKSLQITSGQIENAHAGDGNDRLIGNSADNTLFGGRGDDSLVASVGQDRLDGGAGTDTAVFDMQVKTVTARLIDGAQAVLEFLDGAVTTVTAIERFVFADFTTDFAGLASLPRTDVAPPPEPTGPVAPSTTETLTGTAARERLIGSSSNDLITGEGGDDQLFGRLGDDILRGGIGNDALHGEGGDDWLFGGAGVDVLRGGAGRDVLTGGAGTDRLFSNGDGDRFVFTLDGVTDYDQITGFSVAGGDQIDLSGLGATDLVLRTVRATTTLFATVDGVTHDLARFRSSDIGGHSVASLIEQDTLILA